MKKNIKYIVSITSLVFALSGCSNSFLDEKVLSSFAPESLNDKLGYEAAEVGLYNKFSTFYTTDNDQTYIGVWNLGTDILWAPAGRSNGVASSFFDYTQMTSTDGGSSRVWSYLYGIINNANILIANAEGTSSVGITQQEKDAYNAEARFFRAYSYNMLATLFGETPLITEPLNGAKTDFVRAPIADVNKTIEDDLLFAIANLPDIDALAHKGRAHKAMAQQLLAEVYLRLDKPELAEDQCDAVINSGKFSLIKNRYGVKSGQPGDAFSDMFISGNQRRKQGNTEAIWVLEQENPVDKVGGSSGNPQQRRNWVGAYYDLPGMLPIDSLGGRGVGRVRLDNWVLYGLYKGNDMRNSKYSIHRQHYFNNPASKYSTVFGKKIPYGRDAVFTLADRSTLKTFASDTIFRNAPYITKWNQFDARDTFGYGMWKDFILMRLGETYLLRSEARLKQSNFGGAADDINILRSRANAPFVTAGDITLNFVLDERVRELIGEENRRMTLVRTGTLVERARRLNGTAKLAGGNIATTNGLQSYNVLLPIPQSEIDLNKDAKLEQNPGY